MQEEGSHAWMSDEYKYIIENADRIKTDFKAQPRALQYLSGILTDLLVDVSKFRGVDVGAPHIFFKINVSCIGKPTSVHIAPATSKLQL